MTDVNIKQNVLEFLKGGAIAVISTVSELNQPMSATVYYIVDDNFNFYFMTKSQNRKAKNLEHNRQVALVVGTENFPVTVQIQGTAEAVNDNEFPQKFNQLTEVFSKNSFIAPIFQLKADTFFIYKITPSWIRWLDLRNSSSNKDFVQILP